MTIFDSTMLDEVGHTEDRSHAVLTIEIPGGFKETEGFMRAAGVKMSRYVGFVVSGEFAEKFPQYADLPVIIELKYRGPLPAWVPRWLHGIAVQAQSEGLEFDVVSWDALDGSTAGD